MKGDRYRVLEILLIKLYRIQRFYRRLYVYKKIRDSSFSMNYRDTLQQFKRVHDNNVTSETL